MDSRNEELIMKNEHISYLAGAILVIALIVNHPKNE